MIFAEFLSEEFERRRTANPAYSLRAYARFLGVDHSSLSQMLKGARPIPIALWSRLGVRLGLSAEEIAVFRAAEQVASDRQTEAREQQVRHWTFEAIQLIRDANHQQLLALCQAPDFEADLRWVATRLGIPTDHATILCNRLMRLGFLEMASPGRWSDVQNLGFAAPGAFRRAALDRIRELSPVHLPLPLPER